MKPPVYGAKTAMRAYIYDYSIQMRGAWQMPKRCMSGKYAHFTVNMMKM